VEFSTAGKSNKPISSKVNLLDTLVLFNYAQFNHNQTTGSGVENGVGIEVMFISRQLKIKFC